MAAADGGEILISEDVRQAVPATEFETIDRGRHALKGLPGLWQLYALRDRPVDVATASQGAVEPPTASKCL